jgi:hypothetical protein
LVQEKEGEERWERERRGGGERREEALTPTLHFILWYPFKSYLSSPFSLVFLPLPPPFKNEERGDKAEWLVLYTTFLTYILTNILSYIVTHTPDAPAY